MFLYGFLLKIENTRKAITGFIITPSNILKNILENPEEKLLKILKNTHEDSGKIEKTPFKIQKGVLKILRYYLKVLIFCAAR